MSRPMMHVVPDGTAQQAPAAPAESDVHEMQRVFEAQGVVALQWRRSTASERIARIRRLRESMLAHREALYDAFAQDFRKPRLEVDATEIIPTLDEMRHTMAHLKRWMKPTRVRATMLTLGNSARVEYQPRGRCLIIAPWNYPLYLLFGPLVSALAAGNPIILKPSELAPSVAAVMCRIIRQAFEPEHVAIFEGALQTSQELLAKPFDHIFFTGSPAVGKVVMAAAAKSLASVTLELGGKSPTIVDASADLRKAAETIMWGKFLNCGQTCVAPDHVYVHESVRNAFVAMCRQVVAQRYGATPEAQQASADLTHVINARHTHRISTLLSDAVSRGAQVLMGGQVDASRNYIAPTLITNVPADAAIMSEEIFGPVLPLIGFTDIGQVIAEINAQPKPLALYMWSRHPGAIRRVLDETSSGGVCVNHCMVHVAHGNLPFGGVNNSGIGNAHGVFGFKAFSHERGVLQAGMLNTIKMFFPPYTPQRVRLVGWLANWLGR
ncbi:aldehyde dehydrogenase family protein [Aquabacterium sp.]|uniref:aldehyde dehydrogenase family protein n=1 Tax=Aquabacterium sp. TaxID=1872578 RepID=UPI0035AE7286